MNCKNCKYATARDVCLFCDKTGKEIKHPFFECHKCKDYETKPYCTIIERSNVVQYDTFGLPVRLCLVKYNSGKRKGQVTQEWIDSSDRDGDVECAWSRT